MGALGFYAPPSADRWMRQLGISREAAELVASSDVVDLHVESYSFYRSFGYHPHKRHTKGLNGALLFGQADIPRLIEAGVTGATWVITANPLRPREGRGEAFSELLAGLKDLLLRADGQIALCRNARDYERARQNGQQGAWIGVQGANAMPPEPEKLSAWADDLVRITLMHLTPSAWGRTSAPTPLPGDPGLSALGHEFVERMNELRVGVDLAHIHRRGFWDAVATSDPTVPLLVTHTGVCGVHPHWRNLDDRQCRAVADRGGTIGVMYHAEFLGDPLLAGRIATVARHIRYLVDVVGEDHVSLGSDWDGLICTPRDMPTCLELPRLIDHLLRAGLSPQALRKIMASNWLRVVRDVKGC